MGTKILVVDDNESVCDIYRNMLLGQGYEAEVASTGQEALDLLEKDTFDLILLDIMMPQMDGLHILDLIKSNKESENIKIVMLTALSDEHTKDQAKKYGATDYIVKSEHDMQETLSIISRALSK